jgi:hypothetical protein
MLIRLALSLKIKHLIVRFRQQFSLGSESSLQPMILADESTSQQNLPGALSPYLAAQLPPISSSFFLLEALSAFAEAHCSIPYTDFLHWMPFAFVLVDRSQGG